MVRLRKSRGWREFVFILEYVGIVVRVCVLLGEGLSFIVFSLVRSMV